MALSRIIVCPPYSCMTFTNYSQWKPVFVEPEFVKPEFVASNQTSSSAAYLKTLMKKTWMNVKKAVTPKWAIR